MCYHTLYLNNRQGGKCVTIHYTCNYNQYVSLSYAHSALVDFLRPPPNRLDIFLPNPLDFVLAAGRSLDGTFFVVIPSRRGCSRLPRITDGRITFGYGRGGAIEVRRGPPPPAASDHGKGFRDRTFGGHHRRQRRRRPASGPAYHGQASVDAMALVAREVARAPLD